MESRFWLLIIVAICLIIANTNILRINTFYLLALFGWLAYLIKPIRDNVEDIKELLNKMVINNAK